MWRRLSCRCLCIDLWNVLLGEILCLDKNLDARQRVGYECEVDKGD